MCNEIVKKFRISQPIRVLARIYKLSVEGEGYPSGREIEKEYNISPSRTYNILRELQDMDLIERKRVGRCSQIKIRNTNRAKTIGKACCDLCNARL